MMPSKILASLALSLVIAISGASYALGHEWFPDDGCRPLTSSDGYFYAGGPEANWSVLSGGWNNCHMQVWTSSSMTNWADWYLPIDSAYNHTYSLQAYVSNAGPGPYTTEAIYYGWANGHSGGVTWSGWLDQRANQSGFCYIFGQTPLNGSNGGFMEIINANTKQDGDIYVDVFCFRLP